MDPIGANPASAQFVRRKTRETRFLVLSFMTLLLIATGTILYILRNQSNQPLVQKDARELIPGVPSYAQAVVTGSSESIPETALIRLPGVTVTSIARWEELTETGIVTAEMFSASRSAQEMASGIEAFAGVAGFSLSGRRSSSAEISYTFYKDGRFGTLDIAPQSASTSRIIIKP